MHDDHHPSLFFSVAKNRWRCFVCDIGGAPIDLVMHHRHLSFSDACRWLSHTYGIVSPSSDTRLVPPCQTHYPQPPALGPHTIDRPTAVNPSSIPVSSIPWQSKDGASMSSSFTRAMVQSGMLSTVQMRHAASRYRLDSLDDGAVIFWQIDPDGNIREGKAMYYMANGHRSHEQKPVSMSWLMKHKLKNADGEPLLSSDFAATHCLFGLHLLTEPTPTVAVVESEKTAVVFSELLPDCLWMASGGLSSLTADMLCQLHGRRVILFPDTDTDGQTYRRWSIIASEASQMMHQPIMVSNLLEHCATALQKQQKIDILDFVSDSHLQDP